MASSAGSSSPVYTSDATAPIEEPVAVVQEEIPDNILPFDGVPEPFIPPENNPGVFYNPDDLPPPPIFPNNVAVNPTTGMLLNMIRSLCHEKEVLEEEVTALNRKLISVDIQAQYVYQGVSQAVNQLLTVERSILDLRRHHQTMEEIPNDPSFLSGGRMVAARLLDNGFISVNTLRACGLSFFAEQE